VIDTAGQLYGVLLIDIPWYITTWSARGRGRSAERHYRTMTLAEVRALQLPAARDVAVFSWSPNCMLSVAIRVMEDDWGIAYKSKMSWVKPSIGLGKCFRNRDEILLYGTRGRLPRLAYRHEGKGRGAGSGARAAGRTEGAGVSCARVWGVSSRQRCAQEPYPARKFS
jgi:N6-adenosine-specific RNA methylase IME4